MCKTLSGTAYLRTGTGPSFTRARLHDLRIRHGLKNRYDRFIHTLF